MQTIVLYAVPGAVLTGSALLVSWSVSGWLPSNEGQALLVVASTPILGYLAHDIFRATFQWTGGRGSGHHGGYGRRSRAVLDRIQAAAKKQNMTCSPHHAFLAWEVTIHGDYAPAPFREHDGKSWFFLHTTWTTAAACGVAALLALVAGLAAGFAIAGPVAVLDIVLGVFLLKRAAWNYQSLNDQEEAFFAMHEDAFIDAVRKIRKEV